MKTLILVAALAATACGGDDQLIDTGPTPTTADAPTTTTAQPTTTVAVTTTTTAVVEPEPVTTVPYVAPVTTRRTTTTVPYEAVPSPQGRTTRGGDGVWAIPTYIVMCESGGDWNAQNASGAAGPYQLMPLHFGGESALNQSREAQHAKAAELWAGGAGASHWAACL